MDHKRFPSNIIIDTSDFFQYILENSESTSIFIISTEGKILDMNIAVQKAFGYLKEDIIGKHMEVLFIEEDRKKNLPQMELMTVHNRGASKDNNYVLHKNGSKIWCHGESVFVKTKSSDEYVVKILYDINHQKLLENFLTSSNAKLEQVNNELQNFVYATSHDLKGPLNNLEGLVKMLEKSIEKDSPEYKIMGMINTSVSKFKARLDDLTSVGVEQEKQKNDIKAVNFQDVLNEVRFDLREEIANTNAVITEDFKEKQEIYFSRKDLQSIVFNFISNALKYRSPDRVPEIKVSMINLDDYLLLEVKDNGLGIAKNDHAKVFEMHRRLHNHVEGTGVGMALVKRIIENSGGSVDLESQLNVGSTFKVYFKKPGN